MESDAFPHTSDSSVSIKVPFAVTQHELHVFDEGDTEEVVENQEPESQVQDLIAER